ncbi:OmpA/MotB family protein [Muricomes intestini]|uniref:Chemotaxis protein MotB n=1 Tax=Muricomes intestini TaxID=1796634 RepID=A0A4R3KDY7_9FIRM|nr:flagellar motor protein MotB [Muricomes intestini]TCS81169.1 chemotaxis protein MotB [Muricomes intestini]HAX52485.1 chemotaxis protein MotB [Lachnospiraceae bacterium]HCR84347.1 chemotaxis protein MotB [Lachnospiraceae bacterium]
MRKRRADEEEKSGNGERWLLTYSDLITLLLALFIIMYGMSTENASKVQAVSTALSEAFNSTGAGTGDSTGTGKGGGGGTSLENADPLGTIYKQLNGYIEQNDLEDNVDLVKSDHAISIRLKDKLLFLGDSTVLKPGSEDTLKKVCQVVDQVYGNVQHLTITGNTADLGNHDPENEADSWQLSVDRAVTILDFLTANGLGPEKMSVEGNSHYNPVAGNDTEEGRAANRRVEITITDGAN